MVPENSGKLYRFPLDHDLGYGFAEVYDFTDDSLFDGRYGYAYNRRDERHYSTYDMVTMRSSGVALGPITFYKFPNVRGTRAWKYLFQTTDFLLTERPACKSLQGLYTRNHNWAEMTNWFRWPQDLKQPRVYSPYAELRHLETRILNGPGSLATKFTMKTLLDAGKKVSDYYDLAQLGNRNLYVQLINTYYAVEQTIQFLHDLPNQ